MKAVYQTRYGSPDDLEVREVAGPAIGDDQVLVRVRAASLHPDVWHVVTGQPWVLRLMGGGMSRPRNPIPGSDMSGIVEAAGREVTKLRPGDEVFGETVDFAWKNGGAYAEYVAVREEWLAAKPPNVTFEQAASVPSSGLIALQNLRDRARLGSGKRVLINGAGGGVGSLALQIAKSHGAHVTAVDSTGKLDMLGTLGADRVIDYTRDDFTRLGDRYDLIFDVPGRRPLSALRRVLAADGRYVPIGHEHFGASRSPVLGIFPHFVKLMLLSKFVRHLRGPGIPLPGKRAVMSELRELLDAGKVTPIVDSTYPLERVHAAMRHMTDDELRGKVVLVASGSERA